MDKPYEMYIIIKCASELYSYKYLFIVEIYLLNSIYSYHSQQYLLIAKDIILTYV